MQLLKTSILFVSAVAAQQCKSITDPNAPLRGIDEVISAFVPDFDYDSFVAQIQPALQRLPPGAEDCVANYDASQVADILGLALSSTCIDVKDDMDNSAAMKELQANLPKDVTQVNAFLKYATGVPSESYDELCTSVNKHLVPCVADVAPAFFDSLQEHSNGCCKSFFQTTQEQTGKSPQELVPEFLPLFTNILCASRSPGFDGKASQTCAFTHARVLIQPTLVEMLETLTGSFQMPSDQACGAFEGEQFTRTGSSTTQVIGNKATGTVVSGCSKHLDAFVSTLRAMPGAASNEAVQKLLGDGTCMESDAAVDALPLEDVWKQTMKKFLKNRCLHIANGYSSSCKFSAQA